MGEDELSGQPMYGPTIGSPIDPDVEAAVRSYLGGTCPGSRRSTGEVRAAAEALLDYRVDREDVARVLRLLRDGARVLRSEAVELGDRGSGIIRMEWWWTGPRDPADGGGHASAVPEPSERARKGRRGSRPSGAGKRRTGPEEAAPSKILPRDPGGIRL